MKGRVKVKRKTVKDESGGGSRLCRRPWRKASGFPETTPLSF
jgi:hypothetical protein